MSAAEGEYDDLIGEWHINAYPDQTYGSSTRQPNIAGTFKYYSNGDFVDVPIRTISVRHTSDNADYGWLHVDGYLGEQIVCCDYRSNFTQGYIGSQQAYSFNTSNELFAAARVITITEILENSNVNNLIALRSFLNDYATKVIPPSPTLFENILGTFSEVGSWIGTIISSLVALFWSVETASLTFLGILSVAGLAFSVIMLLFGIVTRFVGFSG